MGRVQVARCDARPRGLSRAALLADGVREASQSAYRLRDTTSDVAGSRLESTPASLSLSTRSFARQR
ncbi:MAG: hypothetical protein U5L01_04060 [Rheinheimera sp.]|nr:hypothetical protein [Rheinheimera sp.]